MTNRISEIHHNTSLEYDLAQRGVRSSPFSIEDREIYPFGDSAPSCPLAYNPLPKEVAAHAIRIFRETSGSGVSLKGTRLFDIGAGTSAQGYIFAALSGCSSYIAIEPFHSELLKSRIPTDPSDFSKFIPELPARLPSWAVISDHALAVLQVLAIDRTERNTFLIMCSGHSRGEYASALGQEILRLAVPGSAVIAWAPGIIAKELLRGGFIHVPADGGFEVFKK